MTEAEWLSSEDVGQMIEVLGSHDASERKYRLLGCGCARLVWHLMSPLGQSAVELAERLADGTATEEELRQSEIALRDVVVRMGTQMGRVGHVNRVRIAIQYWAESAALAAARTPNRYDSLGLSGRAKYLSGYAASAIGNELMYEVMMTDDETPSLKRIRAFSRGAELLECRLLRDTFGNPYRPVTFDPAWRTEHTVGIARRMYDERVFAAMPILADALEEAGCDNTDILLHCREPGEHVRGCWVVDQVLGKK